MLSLRPSFLSLWDDRFLRKRVAAGFHMEGSSRFPGPETTGAMPMDGNGCLLLEAVTLANNYSQEKQQSLELERQYWGPREGKRSEMESNNIRRWEWVWTGSGGVLPEEGCGCKRAREAEGRQTSMSCILRRQTATVFSKELVGIKQQERFLRQKKILKFTSRARVPWHHSEEMERNQSEPGE